MAKYLRVEGKWYGVLYSNTFEISSKTDAQHRLDEWLYRFKQMFGDEPDECSLQTYVYEDEAGSNDDQQ